MSRFTRIAGEINAAVVGLGYWGPNLLRCAHDAEGITVLAACDTDQEALARQAPRYPLVKLTSDVGEVLDDDSIDAVLLATPISTHFEITRRALLAGKHVLVEKPLASSVEECQELIELASERGLLIMPGHTFLYSPPVVAVKRLLVQGELGKIHFISSSRVNLGIHQRDRGVVHDLAPHDFSILLYWLGAPSSVRAIGRDSIVPKVIDVAFIDLGYDDGCLVHLDLSWLAPTKLRRTIVVGDRKMVIYEDTSPEQIRIFDRGVEVIEPQTFGEFQLSYRSGDILSPHLQAAEPLKLEIEDFVEAIRLGRLPRSDVDLGLDVVRMVEATERSLRSAGTSVPLGHSATQDRSNGRARRDGYRTGSSEPARVPLVDLRRSTAPLWPELRACFERVAAGCDFTLGAELAAFEAEFAAYCGVAHCAGVSDGTVALRLALQALGAGPGTDVVTVPYTFIGTVEAIVATGARPVLVDIDPATRCMAPDRVASAIGPDTSVVLPVHLYGRPAPVREIRAVCASAGVPVLEDAAQAHGARVGTRRAGALGAAAAFSFYPSKNLGALGDGGAVASNDAELIEVVRSLRHHGSLPSDSNCHVRHGDTSRLDNLQAAFLRVKLPWLDEWNAQRRRAASLYRELLADAPLVLPPDDPAIGKQVYHLFVVEVGDRDAIRRALHAEGVETGVHYPTPIHLQPVWRERGYAAGDFPATEALASRALSLPMFPGITEAEVHRVADALGAAIEGAPATAGRSA